MGGRKTYARPTCCMPGDGGLGDEKDEEEKEKEERGTPQARANAPGETASLDIAVQARVSGKEDQ